jgi:protein required for attachment to host cells
MATAPDTTRREAGTDTIAPGATTASPRWREQGEETRVRAAKRRWVVVGDEGTARILDWPGPGQRLREVDTLTDAAAHALDRNLRRDAYGRRAPPAPQGSRHGQPSRNLRGGASVTSSAGEDPQHVEAELFARRVARHLGEALNKGRYDELYLAAAPRFLGLLRKSLDPHVAVVVAAELDQDLVREGADELTRRLFPPPAGTSPQP